MKQTVETVEQALLILLRAQYRPVALETELEAGGQAAERMIATSECPERMEINIFLMHSLRVMWALLRTEEKAVRIMSKEEP